MSGHNNRQVEFPRVTVLMPVYNSERFIRAAIESVLRQDFSDFEFLIIDDGSVDDTPKILASYNDPRIRVHRHDVNRGLIQALNLGLAETHSPYVARMDADDIAAPSRLRCQWQWLERHPDVAVLGTAAIRIDPDSRYLERMVSVSAPTDVAQRLMQGSCPIVHSSVMARTNVLQMLGGYRQQFVHAEDYDLWLRVLEHHQIAILPKPLMFYRTNPQGIRLTKILEATQSHEYALDCYRRRSAGKPERTREEFLADFDLTPNIVRRQWSLALEALMLGNTVVAKELAEEIMHLAPDHCGAAQLHKLVSSPFEDVIVASYRAYRRIRGGVVGSPFGAILSNLKHSRRFILRYRPY